MKFLKKILKKGGPIFLVERLLYKKIENLCRLIGVKYSHIYMDELIKK